MKLCIIGTGYVGLPTGVGFAELGHQVVCVDTDKEKINSLQKGILPIYEAELQEFFDKNKEKENITFTTEIGKAVQSADVVMIAVGTPPHPETKEADMRFIHAAGEDLAPHLKDYTVVVIKSTVPVGTGDDLEKRIKEINPTAKFDVVSIPEFLREGFAIHDFFNPDRVVIGTESEKAKSIIKELYASFLDKTDLLFVKRRSSETIKYASNSFLAIKIHYINEIANFCEKTGADVLEVAKGMGLDTRIGNRFLNPGPGFGGSCFPKDTQALAYMARLYKTNLNLIEEVIKENAQRKKQMALRIQEAIKDIPKAKIAILGLAFKNGTDDCRESPAMEIISELIEHHQNITAYDPKAMKNAQKIFGNKITFAETPYQAINGANVLVFLTEWEDFKTLDLKRIKETMKTPIILDLRNLLIPSEAKNLGFTYFGIGRK